MRHFYLLSTERTILFISEGMRERAVPRFYIYVVLMLKELPGFNDWIRVGKIDRCERCLMK